jgi:superfamily II DNA or RNA helicase
MTNNYNSSEESFPSNNRKFRMFIESAITLENAPDEVVAHCIEANSFINPAFLSNEITGRSNWQTERTITTYKWIENRLILPRGFAHDLMKILRDLKMPPEIIDNRISVPCVYTEALQSVTLRAYQERAVSDAMECSQGVIISPTGSGKSLIGLEIIRRRREKALIIVHRSELAKQWLAVISERLGGIKAGFIGDGQWDVGDEITVAMVQTLAAKEKETKSISNAFGLILLDETHHAPASTFFDVLGLFSAKFRYGLSATVQRRDGLEQLIYHATGPTISTISKSEVEEIGATVPATVFSIATHFNPGGVESWNEYLDAITCNALRNELIIDLAEKSEGASLILVDRVEHARRLSEMLEIRNIDHVLAHGKLTKSDRRTVMDRIRTANITIGTTSLLGEGLDVGVWSTLIMGSPISSEIKLLQAIGRIVRPSKGKEGAVVYDLKDNCGFSRSSFKKRFEIYKKNKIFVDFSRNKKAA